MLCGLNPFKLGTLYTFFKSLYLAKGEDHELNSFKDLPKGILGDSPWKTKDIQNSFLLTSENCKDSIILNNLA